MTSKAAINKRYLAASLLLILMAAVVVTASDYWTALRTVMVGSESYAERIAEYLGHLMVAESGTERPFDEGDPENWESHREIIESVMDSFRVVNIKVFNRDGIVIYSLDRAMIGQAAKNRRSLDLALGGQSFSHLVTPAYHETTYGSEARFPMLETYVPVTDPESGEILGAYEICQDYRPLKKHLLSETARSSIAHVFLLVVFAATFYRYGRVTSRFLETRQQVLIRDLEERVDERTLELKRSRDRVSQLLQRKEEMFRNLMIADEYKRDFMGLVSHELRTPLTIIKGYLTMMSDGDLGNDISDEKAVLDTCLEESGKLESIINNILELSQLERGLFDVSAEEFLSADLIREAVDSMEPEIKARNIRIITEISPETSRFTSDRIKILQVLIQFLSNAVKFSTPDSEITITVSPSHRGLLVSVQDEGVGIPEAQVNEIFNLFYQVDISTTRSYEGSGLGLAIVRKIAQILDGRVWVESEEGKGSTFFFEVPALERSPLPVKSDVGNGEARKDIPRGRPQTGETIMVVDDDEEYLFLLRRILVEAGYVVKLCRDGLDCLNRLYGPDHPSLPSLVILDIRMPNIHGTDILRIVRRNMMTREIPVIVVSALGQESQIQEGLEAGANAYFVKPFDQDSLLGRIAFLTGGQK